MHKIRVIVLLAFQLHELFVLPLAAHPQVKSPQVKSPQVKSPQVKSPQEWLLVFAFYVLS
jgi:hypothetical protein